MVKRIDKLTEAQEAALGPWIQSKVNLSLSTARQQARQQVWQQVDQQVRQQVGQQVYQQVGREKFTKVWK